MQRSSDCCPRCDQPLRISCDMWGKYYLCGGCGFTAEDDDELNGKAARRVPPPGPELARAEAYQLHKGATRG